MKQVGKGFLHHVMLSLAVTPEHDAVDGSPVAERGILVDELQMAIEVTMIELVTNEVHWPWPWSSPFFCFGCKEIL